MCLIYYTRRYEAQVSIIKRCETELNVLTGVKKTLKIESKVSDALEADDEDEEEDDEDEEVYLIIQMYLDKIK